MRWLPGILSGSALAGCSFLYNPNNLPGAPTEAGPDAPPDAAIVLDANPSLLELIDIAPSVIEEGQGDLGSPPALLVIHGHQIVNANLRVTLTPPEGVTVKIEPITDAVASNNGDFVAFTVTARVDTTRASDVPLEVTVTEDIPAQYGGGVATRTLATKLTLRGLRELRSTSPEVAGNELRLPLQNKYSMVDLGSTTLRIVGSTPAVIASASTIKMGAIAADAQGVRSGPGGFPGGTTAGQGPGGGGRGGDASLSTLLAGGGGGGGGGATTVGGTGATGGGLIGAGGAGGVGGPVTGDDRIVSLANNAASAGGGGGQGGTLILVGAGGAGGAGGGTVVLIASGDITTGTISANGGAGVTPNTSGGGGGGGGAGGNVLVRTDSGKLTVGAISVKAGAAGMPGGATGSVGRVRWDAPAGNAPSSPDRRAHRGASFVVSTRVFTVPDPSMMVVGTPNDGFTVRVIDHDNDVHDGEHASFNSDGVATINPLLRPGRNQVCVTLDGGAQGNLEADRCIDVAFLP